MLSVHCIRIEPYEADGFVDLIDFYGTVCVHGIGISACQRDIINLYKAKSVRSVWLHSDTEAPNLLVLKLSILHFLPFYYL